MNTEKIYLSFKVGRGGHFHNPGHVTFLGEFDFQELINRCSDSLIIINTAWNKENDKETTLPDSEWKLLDTGNNVILEGRDAIEAKTGVLDFDGDYDKYYTINLEDVCNEKEWNAIREAFKDNWSGMSSELRSAAIFDIEDLNDLADVINACDDYPASFVSWVCFEHGWDKLDLDEYIATDGGDTLWLNDRGEAVVTPL